MSSVLYQGLYALRAGECLSTTSYAILDQYCFYFCNLTTNF